MNGMLMFLDEFTGPWANFYDDPHLLSLNHISTKIGHKLTILMQCSVLIAICDVLEMIFVHHSLFQHVDGP